MFGTIIYCLKLFKNMCIYVLKINILTKFYIKNKIMFCWMHLITFVYLKSKSLGESLKNSLHVLDLQRTLRFYPTKI